MIGYAYADLFSSRPAPFGDYDNLDPNNVQYLTNRALDRDNRLNWEEQAVKEEAERVCILGERYWLRAHP